MLRIEISDFTGNEPECGPDFKWDDNDKDEPVKTVTVESNEAHVSGDSGDDDEDDGIMATDDEAEAEALQHVKEVHLEVEKYMQRQKPRVLAMCHTMAGKKSRPIL